MAQSLLLDGFAWQLVTDNEDLPHVAALPLNNNTSFPPTPPVQPPSGHCQASVLHASAPRLPESGGRAAGAAIEQLPLYRFR